MTAPGGAANDAGDLAIVLGGGGARAAYQVGVLRAIARRLPELRFPIIAGVSAGSINCCFLAAHRGGLAAVVESLTDVWHGLRTEDVFNSGALPLAGTMAHWGTRIFSGGAPVREVRGLVDTRPLRRTLMRILPHVDGEIAGIADNIERGRLRSMAVSTYNYNSGQSVTWVQGGELARWDRPSRFGWRTRLTVEHIMASTALPILFPAVRLGAAWYGDGGLRQATPLAPAIHLGARRILAISTRHFSTDPIEAARPSIEGVYPPPAQILGSILNALFLDVIDEDASRLERINALVRRLPPEEREGLRPVDLLLVHPSQDLGELASELEPCLPGPLRFLARGLGSHETRSSDFLSLLLFQPDYANRLLDLGDADAERQWPALERLLVPTTAQPAAAAS